MSRIPRTTWIQAIRKCGGRCWFCGREAITIDHATPKSKGGTNDIRNLLPACETCNNLKDDMTVRQFRKHVKFLVARKMIYNGMIMGGLGGLVIIFYGEGEKAPLSWE